MVDRRAGGICEAKHRVPSVRCEGRLDVDEWRLRSAGGSHLDIDNCQLLCRAHHDWKHAHPIDAWRAGLRPKPIGFIEEEPDGSLD